jgi:hypothetical protein
VQIKFCIEFALHNGQTEDSNWQSFKQFEDWVACLIGGQILLVKAFPLHATKALGWKGGIAPIHS